MSATDPRPIEIAGPDGFDLDSYLRRIDYAGPRAATLAALRELHRLHPAAIAFENLDPFLGRPVRLDPSALQAKLVSGRRGGYCFEQNLLFMQALRALGFAASGLSARVLWGRPEGAVTPRTHMLVKVTLDGRDWIADVGFGGLTLTAPLLLEPGLQQQTPHEPFRLVAAGDSFLMQAWIGSAWRTLYRFDLSETVEADFEITSYYLSTNPASHFVGRLIAARALPDRRFALLNGRLNVHHRDGRSETRQLASAGELAATLEEVFAIAIPDRSQFIDAVNTRGLLSGYG